MTDGISTSPAEPPVSDVRLTISDETSAVKANGVSATWMPRSRVAGPDSSSTAARVGRLLAMSDSRESMSDAAATLEA